LEINCPNDYTPQNGIKVSFNPEKFILKHPHNIDLDYPLTQPFTYTFAGAHCGSIIPISERTFIRLPPRCNEYFLNLYEANFCPPSISHLFDMYFYVLQYVTYMKETVWGKRGWDQRMVYYAQVEACFWYEKNMHEYYQKSRENGENSGNGENGENDQNFIDNAAEMTSINGQNSLIEKLISFAKTPHYPPPTTFPAVQTLHKYHTPYTPSDILPESPKSNHGRLIQLYVGHNYPELGPGYVDGTSHTDIAQPEPMRYQIYGVVEYTKGKYGFVWIPFSFFLPQKPLLGWKDFEMSVIRNKFCDYELAGINRYKQSMLFLQNVFRAASIGDKVGHIMIYSKSTRELYDHEDDINRVSKNIPDSANVYQNDSRDLEGKYIIKTRCEECFQYATKSSCCVEYSINRPFVSILDGFFLHNFRNNKTADTSTPSHKTDPVESMPLQLGRSTCDPEDPYRDDILAEHDELNDEKERENIKNIDQIQTFKNSWLPPPKISPNTAHSTNCLFSLTDNDVFYNWVNWCQKEAKFVTLCQNCKKLFVEQSQRNFDDFAVMMNFCDDLV